MFSTGRDGKHAYERRIQRAGQREPEVERGVAAVLPNQIYMREQVPVNHAGLLRAMDQVQTRFIPKENARRGLYRRTQGGDALQGRFTVSSERRFGRELVYKPGPDAANNDLQLLVDGTEAYPAIREAIKSAKREVLIQKFSWFDDETGRSIADLCRAKAREGVTVRVLIEAFPQRGGLGWKSGPYMEEAGVEVVMHHGLIEGAKNTAGGFFKKLWRGIKGLFSKRERERPPEEKRGIVNHDHRKFVLVDGRIGFTGGMNIGTKYEEATTWHDLQCGVRGSAVKKMVDLFYERWHAAGAKGEPSEPLIDDEWPGDLRVEVLENLPGIRMDITQRYLQEVPRARRQVLIENAYMLYDPMVDAVNAKAQEGVRTVVIVPSNDLNDEALARDAFLWIQNDMVRAGVELYKYRERMCHGKVGVFDQQRCTIGTTNLDAYAMVHNAEVNLWLDDHRFAQHMTQRVFVQDIPNANRVHVKKLKFWEKVRGRIMYSMRHFL